MPRRHKSSHVLPSPPIHHALSKSQKRRARRKRNTVGSGLYLGPQYTGSGAYDWKRAIAPWTKRAGKLALDLAERKLLGGGLYSGAGAYHSAANNLVAGHAGNTNSVPRYRDTGDETGTVCISHREYLSDVYAPGVAGGPVIAFQNTTYSLNPGLFNFAPLLAQTACNYAEYRFDQLIFEFRSTVTDIGSSTTGQCGTLIMAVNYNVSESPFPDKQTMLEYAHAYSCKTTKDLTIGVECDPKKSALSANFLFTRTAPVMTGQDLKTYDMGLLNLAIANVPPAYNGLPIGELWVVYKVRLRKVKLCVARGLQIDCDSFYNSTALTAATTYAAPFGLVNSNSFLRAQQNNIGTLLTPCPANNPAGAGVGFTITFPASFAGNIKVSVTMYGTGLAGLITDGIIANANIIRVTDIPQGGTVVNTTAVVSGTESLAEFDYYIGASTNGVNNIIGYKTGTASTTITSVLVRIEEYQTLGSPTNQLTNVNAQPYWINSFSTVTNII